MIKDHIKSISSLLHQKPTEHTVEQIPLSDVDPDPKQPRKHFDEESLQELACSIEQYGVLQPIGVREIEDDRYIIVFGERRFRASKLAQGVDTIPALIVDGADSTVQMIENIQRHDLEPHEISEWIQARLDNGETSASIAKRLGKSKGYVSLYKKFGEMPDYLKNIYDRGHCTSVKALVSLQRCAQENEDKVKEFCDQIGAPINQTIVDEFIDSQNQSTDETPTSVPIKPKVKSEETTNDSLPRSHVRQGVIVHIEGSDLVGFLDLKTLPQGNKVRVLIDDQAELFDKSCLRIEDIVI